MPTKKPVRDMSNTEVDDELDKLYKHYNISVEPDGGATANVDLLAANEGRGKAEEAYEASQKQAAAEKKSSTPAKKPKKKTTAAKPKAPAKTENPPKPKPKEEKPKKEKPPVEEKPKPGDLSIPSKNDESDISTEERLKRQRERGKQNRSALWKFLTTNPERPKK